MEQYIKKSAVMAEIRRYIKSAEAFLKYHHNRNDKSVYASEQEKLVMCELLSFLDTLETKEIDLEKELRDFVVGDIDDYDMGLAKHFYELGMRANNPITAADRGIAEEIIISLKQVENDYYLDQTKEIEWVRNKVKEEEEV
jgi:hypothetical protein